MTDGVDLAAVTVHNSPDVQAWPATATITKLEFRSTGVHVEHTKNVGPGAWPNFRPVGWDGDLQYTLWIFLNIGGRWHGSGCIQFWQDCDQNGGPPEEFAKNWYYAADRWWPMTGYQPKPGELVGFMVSAGDARNQGIVSVQERSNIVKIPFPSSGTVYLAPDHPAPPEPLPPQPHPGHEPGPQPVQSDVLALLNTMRDEIILTKLQGADLVGIVTDLAAKVAALSTSPSVTFPEYTGRVSIKVLNRTESADIVLKPRVTS